MSQSEQETARFVTLPFKYAIAVAYDLCDYTMWYHVVEKAEDGIYYSIYRAASLEDANDVLMIYSEL